MPRGAPFLILAALLVAGISACSGVQTKKDAEEKSAEAYYQLGVQELSEGNYQKALLDLRRAEALEPRDARIYNVEGLVYFYTARYDKAEQAYRKAIAYKKDYSEARVNLGVLLARRQDCDQAITEFRKALENPFYPTPALSLHNIGLCYQRMGKTQEAEEALVEAVQQDPSLIRAYFDLGRLYYAENRMDQAIQVLQQAVERHPEIPGDKVNAMSRAHLHYWLGLSYFKNGDSENAVSHFREVTTLTPESKLSEEAWKYLNLLQ